MSFDSPLVPNEPNSKFSASDRTFWRLAHPKFTLTLALTLSLLTTLFLALIQRLGGSAGVVRRAGPAATSRPRHKPQRTGLTQNADI